MARWLRPIAHTGDVLEGVQDQASLYALGTAEKPIVFTGQTQEPGWWTGIDIYSRSDLVLRHCEIGYGDGNAFASLNVRWGLFDSVPAAHIQNCEIHHSSQRGMRFDFNNYQVASPPVFRYNHIYDNAQEGGVNWNGPPLNARDNYWGDPSGPLHPTQNPDGLGDNILFYPWLDAPPVDAEPVTGDLMLSVGGPLQISPGQTVDYAIQYLNLMTTTVENAVLIFTLPKSAMAVDTTGGGIDWPERHQVFWKLGDLAVGAQGVVSLRVRFLWGLDSGLQDGSLALLIGSGTGGLDAQPYLDYQPVQMVGQTTLSDAQVQAERVAYPDLDLLVSRALSSGLTFLDAVQLQDNGGNTQTRMTFANQRGTLTIRRQGDNVWSDYMDPIIQAAGGATGGVTVTLPAFTAEYWGDWQGDSSVENASIANSSLSAGQCFRNCIIKKVAGTILGLLSRPLALAFAGPDCFKALKGDEQAAAACFLAL